MLSPWRTLLQGAGCSSAPRCLLLTLRGLCGCQGPPGCALEWGNSFSSSFSLLTSACPACTSLTSSHVPGHAFSISPRSIHLPSPQTAPLLVQGPVPPNGASSCPRPPASLCVSDGDSTTATGLCLWMALGYRCKLGSGQQGAELRNSQLSCWGKGWSDGPSASILSSRRHRERMGQQQGWSPTWDGSPAPGASPCEGGGEPQGSARRGCSPGGCWPPEAGGPNLAAGVSGTCCHARRGSQPRCC